MPRLEKLVTLASLAQTLYGGWLFKRLLFGAIVVAGLAIVSALMTATLVIGSFYALYFAFLHFGIDPQSAVAISVSLFALITALFIAATILYLRHVQEMPRKLWRQSLATTHVGEVVDAFLEGFNAQ